MNLKWTSAKAGPAKTERKPRRHRSRTKRSNVSRAVNSALVQLYWQVGTRIRTEVLQNERAATNRIAAAKLHQAILDARKVLGQLAEYHDFFVDRLEA